MTADPALTVLVLGSSGQVAKCLGLLNNPPGIVVSTAGRETCDITSLQQIKDRIVDVQPDVVINAAAYTAVDKAEDEVDLARAINELGAGNAALAAAEKDIPLIHISTDYVFSGEKEGAYIESDETNPTGVYGQTKLAGEHAVRSKNPKHVIVRTSWVYSSIGQNFVKTMLRLSKERDQLGVVDDQTGCPSSATEIAKSLLLVARTLLNQPNASIYGTYHFCGTDRCSWAEFAEHIFRVSSQLGGKSALVNKITTQEYPTAAKRPQNSSLNYQKFTDTFGYSHAPLTEALHPVVMDILTQEVL